MTSQYMHIPTQGAGIKAWVNGVAFDGKTQEQLRQTAELPIVFKHVAAMPDCHVGMGSTVGSVIPTKQAIIPAAVGVDLGCGMIAVETSLRASDMPDDLKPLREAIERVIPVGQRDWGKSSFNDKTLRREYFKPIEKAWKPLDAAYRELIDKYPKIKPATRLPYEQLGSLGGGNHFIEICVDTEDQIWIMLHSGSRGIGNQIGRFFIEKAREDMERLGITLSNQDLSYLSEGTIFYDDYVQAVEWAQHYAKLNRDLMLENVIQALRATALLPEFSLQAQAINCHHNYISYETHFNEAVWITRKGAIRAREGELGIIPGSMGAKSFIVKGKGNVDAYHSCSHGAGRVMSRTQARKSFTVADHIADTAGVECRKDVGVIDETPKAYKDIDAVMAAQSDLVDVVATLKQIVCVKG